MILLLSANSKIILDFFFPGEEYLLFKKGIFCLPVTAWKSKALEAYQTK